MFYRAHEGKVAAVEDFCPHRGAPLSLGYVCEGKLVCGYHGLEMGCDVKTIAIDNLAAAGIRITPVVTVVNGVNNHQVGPIFDFCLANHDKMGGPAFQPVSFTGRDEEVTDEARLRQRYTTSHLAHDLARYYDGRIDPKAALALMQH